MAENREVGYVNVKGHRIGVSGLPEIFDELKKDGPSNPVDIKEILLQKVKKYNYVADGATEDYKTALYREYRRYLGEEIEDDEIGLVIKILGPGCPSCEKLENEVRQVVQELNFPADIEHVRDLKQISKFGIVTTPGLVINRKLISTGRVPARNQLKEWLLEAVNATKNSTG